MTLSDAKLRNIRPTGERRELPDRDGLVLRVSQRGVMTWAAYFRVRGASADNGSRVEKLAGKKRRVTIGAYPEVSLSEARTAAASIARAARAGVDPSAAVVVVSHAPTVGDLFERYGAEHLDRHLKSGRAVRLLLERHVLPNWRSKALATLRRSDLASLLEGVRPQRKIELKPEARRPGEVIRGGSGAVAEVRPRVRAMFQFGVEVELIPENPFAGVRSREHAPRRDRVLTMSEIAALCFVCERLDHLWAAYFRLLMLTGNRRAEWAEARIDWLAEQSQRLEIPAAYYKTGKPQVVPLSTQAIKVLNSLPRPTAGPYLLSFTGGLRPLSGFSKAKARLDESFPDTPLAPWVVHDIRRSVATHMERIGVAPHVIELCLGHALRGVAATYRHYAYLPEKSEALQRWADELSRELLLRSPISPPDAAAPIPLPPYPNDSA